MFDFPKLNVWFLIFNFLYISDLEQSERPCWSWVGLPPEEPSEAHLFDSDFLRRNCWRRLHFPQTWDRARVLCCGPLPDRGRSLHPRLPSRVHLHHFKHDLDPSADRGLPTNLRGQTNHPWRQNPAWLHPGTSHHLCSDPCDFRDLRTPCRGRAADGDGVSPFAAGLGPAEHLRSLSQRLFFCLASRKSESDLFWLIWLFSFLFSWSLFFPKKLWIMINLVFE